MLHILPDMVFPVTQAQCDPLMKSVAQLNLIDGCLSEKQQRGLGLYLHIYDLWVKSGGKIDYRGAEGQNRLIQDAMTFCGTGNPVATRHGDLAAAHLGIDHSDTQLRLIQYGFPQLPADVNTLLKLSVELCEYPPEMEKRVGLFLDYASKRRVA